MKLLLLSVLDIRSEQNMLRKCGWELKYFGVPFVTFSNVMFVATFCLCLNPSTRKTNLKFFDMM
jgi:hypothetical protein